MRIKSVAFSRLILSFAVLFFVLGLFISFSFSPSIQTTKACPPPPSALRELIMRSDRIVIATVSGSTLAKVENENESGKYFMMRFAFNVSDTLKGSSVEPLVHIYRYRFIVNAEAEAAQTSKEEFEIGKKLLLFLRKSNEKGQDGYFLTDYSQGIKDLSDDELSIYVSRINEFVGIMKDKQPDKNKIVEWLVRCAEEPATRWDGAYDLSRNFGYMRYEEAEKAREKNKAEDKDSTEESEEAAEEQVETNKEIATSDDVQIVELSTERDDFAIYDAELAKLLTDAQKERLANALFNTEKLSNGDHELIDLVKNWEGKKVATFLLPRLRQLSVENSGDASYFMYVIAEILEDKELTKLAEMYSEISYSDDDEIIDPNELEAGAQDQSTVELQEENEETVNESEEGEGETETLTEAANDVGEKDKAQKTGLTVEQVKSNLMQRFITLCESLSTQ